ncbi:sporulation integral membrane protein YtvI [Hazenella coriacea]|uniref:Sporulation integral membrane protein YtvI n=1 Tax=Hazenella coriacea TaxID=1179467 RepID=A0A4R3LGV7_9BACL|nr:sporulation integral membrane protein YtvI [Hazenella coriacea]TCS96746.1 sporulation integral membrane protein YtvI [Hazenella coriacea]
MRSIIVLLTILVAYYLIDFLLPLLYPFIIGWVIAMLIEPLVLKLEKRGRFPRWLSVTIILVLLVSMLFTLLIFVIAEIVVELAKLAEFLPTVLNQVGKIFVDTFTKENTSIKRIIDTIQTYLEKNPQQEQRISASIQSNIGVIANKGTEVITSILSWIGSFISNLPSFLTVLVFIMLAAFFISLDWPRLKQEIKKLLPRRLIHTTGLVYLDMKKALFGFIRAQLTLISITAVIMFAGLLIIQVPYAFSIALIIGLVDLMPYLGVGAVLVPWIIYLVIVGNYQLAIGLSIVYGVIIIVRQFLEPKLVASNVGLDPLLTLIALFVGLKLFGVFGLIIGPVTAVILLALHRAHVFKDIWRFITDKKKTDIPHE